MPCSLLSCYFFGKLCPRCRQLGVEYVDLYLIHSPRLAVPDIPTVWSQMEQVQNDGLAK